MIEGNIFNKKLRQSRNETSARRYKWDNKEGNIPDMIVYYDNCIKFIFKEYTALIECHRA